MKTVIKLLTIVLTTLLLNPQTTTAQCHIDDWTALKALYESTNGDFWTNRAGWDIMIDEQDNPPDICSLENLYGLRLDNDGRVDSLDLANNQLNGYIPRTLEMLSSLKNLSFDSNDITGSIPIELGNLFNLTELLLHHNDLTGSIPVELGNLHNLNYLSLSFNKLTGNIPSQIGNLNNLSFLTFSYNNLTGVIPSHISNLSNLTELYLKSNGLVGNIPSGIGDLVSLKTLDLSNNQLNGSIPIELGNLANLDKLHLNFNHLSDRIPATIGNLENLRILTLYSNHFNSDIPSEIGNLTNLVYLRIHDNELLGCYDENLTSLCDMLVTADISDGNNFDATWEDFCATGAGTCEDNCINDCETSVYPGDLNHDGIVNNQDVSLSGLFQYQSGIARAPQHQSIVWDAYPAQDWGIVNNQDKDIKHHDCNGDGIIDEADQQAVEDNLGLTWDTPPPPNPPDESDYQVMLQPTDQIYDGNLVMNVSLERRAGGDLTLQGGHFTVDYSDIEGNFSFVGLAFLPISWLGTPDNNLWYESTHLESDKKIEVGFTKTNNVDSEGSGIIGQLILEYDNSLARQAGASNISYNFEVNAIGVHQNNGDFIPIEDQQLEIIIDSDICYSNLIIDEEAPFQNLYKSTNTITTNDFVIIGANQKVEFNANRVRINAGFSAKAGADFKVRNIGCN